MEGRQFIAPKLTEDDAFLSNPGAGTIVYRIPAPHILMGYQQKKLGTFEEMWFEISILTVGSSGRIMLTCPKGQEYRCKIRFHRHYTPLINYISPPVNYYDQVIQVHYDPKSLWNKIDSDLPKDEMPFINCKIGSTLIDFEDFTGRGNAF